MDIGVVIAKRYRLEERGGGGSMGALYRAFDLERGVPVAIKFVRATGHTALAARFGRECQALASMVHDHVVGYVDHGLIDDEPYLVMDWLDGCDLSRRLDAGPLSVAQTIAIGRQVCSALEAIHGAGIIHRDIKPANLFLVDRDIERLVLVDFGVARLTSGGISLTKPGAFLGTPNYIAPEQARGDSDVDARADLYSLGAVLFACLTGRPPFAGKHLMAVMAKLLMEPAPSLRTRRPEISVGLEALITRLLAKDRKRRPMTAAEVTRALDDISAPPPRTVDPTLDGSANAADGDLAAHASGEQRIVSLLLMGPAPAAHRDGAPPLAKLGGTGVNVQWMSDGTALAVFDSTGDATEMATRAAGYALAAREHPLLGPVVIATGRGVLARSAAPVGEVIERAVSLYFAHDETLPTAYEPSSLCDIVVDDVTAGLLQSRFILRRARAGGYLLIEKRTRPSSSHDLLGTITQFVGRNREVDALSQLYDECADTRAPRIALVTGEAGTGKSRLADELLARLVERDDAPRVWTAHGDPTRGGSPLDIASQLVAHGLDLERADPPQQRRQRIRERAGARFKGDDAARIAAFLGEIVNTPFAIEEYTPLRDARIDPQAMHHQMQEAWLDWLHNASQQGPIALVIDDLQWGDLPSIRFVDAALRNLSDRPVFALALARPEVHDAFPDLWSKRDVEQIPLKPLDRNACLTLARQLAPRAAADHLQALIDHAGGNPFYIEELLRHDAIARSDALPGTVLAMVAARLAALPTDARRVLRAASVLGQSFWAEAVGAQSGLDPIELEAQIRDLIQRGILRARRRSRFQGFAEYAFHHNLTREAAYATLTESARIHAHRAAGRWLEHAGESDALVLAEQFWRGRDRAAALPHFHKAAQRALEADDLHRVVQWAERAVACGADGERLGQLRLLQAEAHNWRGEHEDAAARAIEARDRLAPGSGAWAHALHQWMWASVMLGRSEDADAGTHALIERAAETADPLYIAALIQGAIFHAVSHNQARVDKLLAVIADCSAPHANSRLIDAWQHMLQMYLADQRGDYYSAATHSKTTIGLWEIVGNQRLTHLQEMNLGKLLLKLGRPEDSVRALEAGFARARRTGIHYAQAQNTAFLHLAYARLGRDPGDAADIAEQGSAAGSYNAGNEYRAQLALIRGEYDAALRECADMQSWTDAFPAQQALGCALRAQALLGLERADEALDWARRGMRLLDELGSLEEGDVLLRLVYAEALRATGRDADARIAIAQAARRVREQADMIPDPAWRESFLTRVPENLRSLDLARAWTAAD